MLVKGGMKQASMFHGMKRGYETGVGHANLRLSRFKETRGMKRGYENGYETRDKNVYETHGRGGYQTRRLKKTRPNQLVTCTGRQGQPKGSADEKGVFWGAGPASKSLPAHLASPWAGPGARCVRPIIFPGCLALPCSGSQDFRTWPHAL